MIYISLLSELNRPSKVLVWVSAMAATFFLSGCGKYAMKEDLTALQQKSEKARETDQEIIDRLSRIEQAPKADPEVLAALLDRVEKISMYALELERRVQAQADSQAKLQPQMTLGVRPVSVEDITGLVKKIDELEGQLKSINVTKVPLNSISFPPGKVSVADLSGTEMSRLRENAERIREEKPSRVTIISWADGSGAPDKNEKAAAERARNIESYYREKVGRDSKVEFLTEFKVASASGPYWRRAETTMWMAQDKK